MKTNCRIADTEMLAQSVAEYIESAIDFKYSIQYKLDSCYLNKEGTLHFVMRDRETGLFTDTSDFSVSQLAHIEGFHKWEIVEIEKCGVGEHAILFYDEK